MRPEGQQKLLEREFRGIHKQKYFGDWKHKVRSSDTSKKYTHIPVDSGLVHMIEMQAELIPKKVLDWHGLIFSVILITPPLGNKHTYVYLYMECMYFFNFESVLGSG